MLRFAEYSLAEDYINEDYLIEKAASSEVLSDDKGKLHELLLAKHLHPEQKLPLHHRSESENPEHAGTPEQVHEKLRKKVGEAAYNEIDAHAKDTAQNLMKHLQKQGHIGSNGHALHDIHWTSNRDTEKKPGDHEKTVGKKDMNSNADLILTTKHPKTGEVKHIGISAKYGGQAEPNYRNDGLKALETKSGLPEKSLSDIQKDHENRMTGIGYTGSAKNRHAQYKLDKIDLAYEKQQHKALHGSEKGYEPKSESAKRAHIGEQSSLEARTEMAKRYSAALGSGSPEEVDSKLREHIRGQVAAPTLIPHVVAHSHVQDNGSIVAKIKPAETIADEHLNKYSNLRVRPATGISSDIVGTYNNPGHKDHGKEVVIARQNFKASSGPHKGTAGAFKLEGTNRPAASEGPAEPTISKPALAKKPAKKKGATAPAPVDNGATGEFGGHKF